jgi:hypothetical protein
MTSLRSRRNPLSPFIGSSKRVRLGAGHGGSVVEPSEQCGMTSICFGPLVKADASTRSVDMTTDRQRFNIRTFLRLRSLYSLLRMSAQLWTMLVSLLVLGEVEAGSTVVQRLPCESPRHSSTQVGEAAIITSRSSAPPTTDETCLHLLGPGC